MVPDIPDSCPCHQRLQPGELGQIKSDFENSKAYHYHYSQVNSSQVNSGQVRIATHWKKIANFFATQFLQRTYHQVKVMSGQVKLKF